MMINIHKLNSSQSLGIVLIMKFKKFLSQSPIFAMYQGNALVIEHIQSLLEKDDVHLLQGFILTAIFFEEKEVRPLELASTFKLSKSNLSHALRSLEKKGFVRRSTNVADARGYWFSLTTSGKKKALLLIKIFDGIEDKLDKLVGVKSTKEFVSTSKAMVEAYQYKIKSQA